MNQEIVVGLGLIILAYFLTSSSDANAQVPAEDNYLMNKYNLTENEYRIFTYIADPIKREQYLNHVIRSKQKY